MHSPLARVIVALLGGYLLILLLMLLHDWIEAEFPRPPAQPQTTTRVQHPFYHAQAVAVLQRFERLADSDKSRIKCGLEAALLSMDAWLARLEQFDCRILCLGELHEEATRRFLADAFFTGYRFDVLMLETTPDGLKRLNRKLQAGRDYFPLLDADIMAVLRSTRARNASIEIVGIEETEDQQGGRAAHPGSRDQSIARNFRDRFQPGKRHVVLFGALHCADEAHWLYGNLRSTASNPLKAKMLNVRVLGEHQNGPVEAFVFFLDEIGIAVHSFVIDDAKGLPPRIYGWFPLLKARIMDKFQVLIVFRQVE